MRLPHAERHRSGRGSWLRAAVLGSDDAIVSTASLMIGVAASAATKQSTLIAGVAGVVAGAMSMAVGEFVSVSAQRDAEKADVDREKKELVDAPDAELRELTQIYEKRGLSRALATQVAMELTRVDPLRAHLRDELGIDATALARPLQAGVISALSFAVFGLVPIVALLVAPVALRTAFIAGFSLLSLAVLGSISGRVGGASPLRAGLRVTLGGGLAMGVTAAIGKLFDL